MVRRTLTRLVAACSLLALALVALPAQAQQGFVLNGVGPINRSMGGASTAAPLDAAGAIHWNPATISGLPGSELEAGVSLALPQSRLTSSVAPGAFGPGLPPFGLAGSDPADNGVFAAPFIGLVYKQPDSDLTFGLGVLGVGGFGVNYPGSTTNPILMPQPFGLGAVDAELLVVQLAPTLSYQITDHLSVGLAPTVDLAFLQLNPGFFIPPDNAAGGPPTFPSALHTRTNWGAGFQAGVFYKTDAGWNFGTALKSPQWFEPFRYNAVDQLGFPVSGKFTFVYPLISTTGIGYTGFEGWVLAADFRYVDYHDAEGLEGARFDPNGAIRNIGWRSLFGVLLGAQYQLTSSVSVRIGYDYNTNPVPEANTGFNAGAPTIIQHTITCGASYKVTENFIMSVSYLHGFKNSITGPFQSPFGPVAGTSITNQVADDSFSLGATVKF
jgi:long-chain fatty acid transport protein